MERIKSIFTLRTTLELILICIIIFLLSVNQEIRVDNQGFVKNVALNFSFTGDGALVVSDPEGKVIGRSPIVSINTPHTIAITTVGNKNKDHISNSFLDTIIPSAFAAGKFFKIISNTDGQITCRWFNDNTPC